MKITPIPFKPWKILRMMEWDFKRGPMQTRRIIKLPPAPEALGAWEPTTVGGVGVTDSKGNQVIERAAIWHTRTGKCLVCPYGQAGDLLWVRLTIQVR